MITVSWAAHRVAEALQGFMLLAGAGAVVGIGGCFNPDLTGVTFECVPGQPGNCPDGDQCNPIDKICEASCVYDLSGVGTSDFTIKFKLATTATVASTVLYQRSTCDARNDLWDVQVAPFGGLRIAVIEHGGAYTDLNTSALVNNGALHGVVIKRVNLVMTTSIDGVSSGSAPAPQNLTSLPALGTASGDPCEVADVHPLVGTVSGVCLSIP